MSTNLSYLNDETRDELAQLALGLANNGKTRKQFLGLVKTAKPDTPIPELDAQESFHAELAKRDKAFEDFKRDQEEKEYRTSLESKKSAAKDKYSLDDDAMKKMEEMMGKKELPADYEWAARLYQQQAQPAEPTSYGSSGYGPVDVEGFAKGFDGLMDDSDNWSRRTAHDMIESMKQKGHKPAF